ncbi:hypothetical protein ACHAXS_013051 [Conticribra weissflogii]
MTMTMDTDPASVTQTTSVESPDKEPLPDTRQGGGEEAKYQLDGDTVEADDQASFAASADSESGSTSPAEQEHDDCCIGNENETEQYPKVNGDMKDDLGVVTDGKGGDRANEMNESGVETKEECTMDEAVRKPTECFAVEGAVCNDQEESMGFDDNVIKENKDEVSNSTAECNADENAAADESLVKAEELYGEKENQDEEASESESDLEEDDEEETRKEEEMPEGDSNADLHALLAFSKSRLEKVPRASPAEAPVEENCEEDEEGELAVENETNAGQPIQVLKEEEELEIAKKKLLAAQQLAEEDDAFAPTTLPVSSPPAPPQPPQTMSPRSLNMNLQQPTQSARSSPPVDLLKIAEQKVKEAEMKAKQDEITTSSTSGEVVKPAVSTTKRSEANAELWALLNYSKRRLETGATPQMGKSASKKDGKDDVSVSSKTSKRSLSSKKSITSKASGMGSVNGKAPVSEVSAGGLNLRADFNEEAGSSSGKDGDAHFPDVGNNDDDDEGSVGSDMKNSIEEDEESQNSDNESSSSEEEDEEDELPDFLKSDDTEEVDPEEAKRLYQAARSYGASILSVSEEKLTDVQMLQAIAIAEEAAKKGESKFSTKSSLFKLHEAKLEDLKAFLDFGGNEKKSDSGGSNSDSATKKQSQSAQVGWGIGKGRLIKKVGAVFQDFKQRCEEIDERKQQARKLQPSNKEIFSAALMDLKKELDNYEAVQVMKRKASMEGK